MTEYAIRPMIVDANGKSLNDCRDDRANAFLVVEKSNHRVEAARFASRAAAQQWISDNS